MSRRSVEQSEEHYPYYNDAFKFLNRFGTEKYKYDLSSTFAISKPPRHITEVANGLIFDEEPASGGPIRGRPEVLEICREYFMSKGINCSVDNITLADGILDSLPKIYRFPQIKNGLKVLVVIPTFGFYLRQLIASGVEFDIFETTKEEGFLPNPQKLDKKIKESKITAILMCNPNNPTGVVMTKVKAEQIAKVVIENDIFVISDEIFIENPLCDDDDKEHFPIAAVPGMLGRSLTLTTCTTKAIGLPLIHTCICVGPPDIVENFAKLGGHAPFDKVIEIIYGGIHKDSSETREFLEENKAKYLANIALIKSKIHDLNQALSEQFDEEREYVKPFIENPEAGNIYLLDFSGLRGITNQKTRTKMETGLDIAEWCFEEASVSMVPGECFLFDPEEMLTRISIGHSPRKIIKAFDSIIEATKVLQKSPSISPEPHEATRPNTNIKSQETAV